MRLVRALVVLAEYLASLAGNHPDLARVLGIDAAPEQKLLSQRRQRYGFRRKLNDRGSARVRSLEA